MPQLLEGRRILLTGASRGIGSETAKVFLELGAQVIGVGRDRPRLAAVAKSLAKIGPFHPVMADLATAGFERALVQAVEQHFGGTLDVLFNNAGVMLAHQGIDQEPDGTLEETLQVNVLAVQQTIRALLPFLLRGSEPRIINTSSGAGNFASVAMNEIASYRVSKFALNGLTMSWAEALKGRVAVNAFDPGWVKTDLGGAKAPGTVQDSARGAVALVSAPFAETGRFWKDGAVIAW
jgi:NAD(P)-dependent dehydrogenase (short-subunit alcohol dehydrogenase family)